MFVRTRYLLRLSIRILLGRMAFPLPPNNMPSRKVVATLLMDVRLHPKKSYHHIVANDPHMHPGLVDARDPDQRAAAAVGGWCGGGGLYW